MAQEYTEDHYRFFRDTTAGYNRGRYVGSTQTQETTLDGEPAAESLLSSEGQLIVKDGTPVKRDKKESGPILDVE